VLFLREGKKGLSGGGEWNVVGEVKGLRSFLQHQRTNISKQLPRGGGNSPTSGRERRLLKGGVELVKLFSGTVSLGGGGGSNRSGEKGRTQNL